MIHCSLYIHSYPAILVVPSKVTDEALASLAGQFQCNRWPVVTWKHPKKEAVLLRSSSFVPSSIAKKKFNPGAVGAKLLPASITQKHMASDKIMQNKAGVGVYNTGVENYFYDLMLVTPADTPSLDLVQHISMPPETIEFEELKRQGSFRGGYHPPPSPSPSNNSSEYDIFEQQEPEKTGIRSRAATYTYKIRNRVGSSVSQLSRVVVPGKKEHPKSPAVKRKLSARRKMFSSPQLPRKKGAKDTTDSRPSSTSSDISTEKAKWRESLKEEPEEVEDNAMSSSDLTNRSSPTTSEHVPIPLKRARSSDEVVDMKFGDIDLKDIVVSEKSGSPDPPVSPIDWEAIGNDRETVKVRSNL